MVFAVWAARSRSPRALAELEDALVSSVRLARAEPEQLAFEAAERYGYPAGFLARYFEKLRYRFGPRERAGLYTFLELARDVGRARRACPSSASSRRSERSHGDASTSPTAAILEKALDGERITDEDAVALLESRDLVAVGRAANELRDRCTTRSA